MQNYVNSHNSFSAPQEVFHNGLSPQEQALHIERRSLRRTATAVGVFVLIYYLSMYQARDVLFQIVANTGVVTEDIQTILLMHVQIIISIVSVLFATLLYRLIFRRKIGDGIPKSFVKPDALIPLLFLGMGAAMIANTLAGIFDSNISLFQLKNYAVQSMNTRGVSEMVLYVVSTAVVPALAEELAFRGIVMGALRKYGDAFAIFASSLLFGAMHGNTTQIVFAFILGLIFAFADCKANSVVPSILIHFTNNFYAVVEDILKSNADFDEKTLLMIRFALVFTFCLLGILSYLYLALRDKQYFRVSNADSNLLSDTDVLPYREKIKLFFTSAGVIVALCLFFSEMVFYLLPPTVREQLTKMINV